MLIACVCKIEGKAVESKSGNGFVLGLLFMLCARAIGPGEVVWAHKGGELADVWRKLS